MNFADKLMRIPAFKTYLFDVDGTLINTADFIHCTFSEVFAGYGVSNLTKDKIISLMGYPLKSITRELLGPDHNLDQEIAGKICQLQSQRCHLTDLFPDVKEGLQKLKNSGRNLGIVTSRNPDTLHLLLDFHGIGNLFDVIVTPASTLKHKPHPEPIQYAMRAISSEPADTVYIGDAAVDIDCGRTAGVKTALVSWTKNNPANFANQADFYIDSFNQF